VKLASPLLLLPLARKAPVDTENNRAAPNKSLATNIGSKNGGYLCSLLRTNKSLDTNSSD
jgi:hypothetical protein